jgi:polygalacturonase
MAKKSSVVSRRQWVRMVGVPAVAATALAAWPDVAAGQSTRDSLVAGAVYDINKFGAKGDGTTLDTAAVQNAIDQCNADGGGTVLVPGGTFVIGTIELKSFVTLHLEPKGKLLGSPNIAHYHAGNNIPRGNGNIVLISAADADNVTIEGRGTIDGNGAKFFTGKGDNTGPGQDSSAGYFNRPHLLIFSRCRNLLIRDVFLTASAYHCCRILNCRYVRLEGVRIHNRVNKNNDGFHFNSSEYVNITNCNIACQDDACALFGSNKFVTVTNCSFSTRWSIFRFGGGNPEQIAISNCLIYDTFGCPIKMRFGRGSRAENISFSNLVFRNVTGPISIGLDSRRRRASTTQSAATSSAATTTAATTPSTAPAGIVRNIFFNGIRGTVVAQGFQHEDLPFPSDFRPGELHSCIVINGAHADDVIENISLENVHLTFAGGGTIDEANRRIPEMAGEYFEIGTPPAYGIYARNARGLTLHNVRLETAEPDQRPAIVLDHVEDATIDSLAAHGDPRAAAVVRCTDSRHVLITSPRVLTPATVFLKSEGASDAIIINGGDLTRAKAPRA